MEEEIKLFKELFALGRYLKTAPGGDEYSKVVNAIIGKKFIELKLKGVSALELLDIKPLHEVKFNVSEDPK